MELWVKAVAVVGASALLISYFFIQARARQRHERACFDAMLRMLLQPTPANIDALEKLLKLRSLSDRARHKLLYQAEVEADCLSIMPTGELRSSQPFLQQRYNQILATSEKQAAVSKLVKTRLVNLRPA